MWQFLIVAAVAGSTGFFAKHLSIGVTKRKQIRGFGEKTLEQEFSGSDQTEMCGEPRREFEVSADSVETQVWSPTALQSPLVPIGRCVPGEEGIFWFSSPESGSRNGSRPSARSSRKKGGFRSGEGVRPEQKSGSSGGRSVRVGVEQRKGVRRFSVCLKRRRTGKNLGANKSGSCPSEGGSSFFGWGLGVGMMYMMSAGKSEISKLNTAMDETAKAIDELKADLKRRKPSSSIQVRHSSSEFKTIENREPNELGTENREPDDIKLSRLSTVDDIECPSSVLTEEQEPELLEMDQLEAEFVSELQKLPWCSADASHPDCMRQNFPKFNQMTDTENEMGHPYQFDGVKPSELDKKLSHLLIEQQGNQITELECELQTAQLKLNEKEAELQALKDCVRRLTELSLSTITDDETEAFDGVGCTDTVDYNNMARSETKMSVVGMKRSIDSQLCGY